MVVSHAPPVTFKARSWNHWFSMTAKLQTVAIADAIGPVSPTYRERVAWYKHPRELLTPYKDLFTCIAPDCNFFWCDQPLDGYRCTINCSHNGYYWRMWCGIEFNNGHKYTHSKLAISDCHNVHRRCKCLIRGPSMTGAMWHLTTSSLGRDTTTFLNTPPHKSWHP